MFDAKDCIAFVTNRDAKLLSESMNQRFREKCDEGSRAQCTALFYVDQNPGITQKELADILTIAGPTAMHMIDRMEKDKLIERKPDSDNRRVRRLFLTEKGKETLQILMPIVEEFNVDAQKGIPQEEMDIFKNVLQKLVENVSNM